jgi:hypothetical protein
MTRGQWTLIGLLVVQAMLIAVLRNPATAGPAEPGSLVPELDTAKVMRVEVGTTPDEKLVLERNESAWTISTADGYPADASKVNDLLTTIRDARTRTAVVTSDKYHESLEVTEEKAQARIRLYREGESDPFVDLIIGKTTSGGAHVRIAGEEDVWDVRDLTPWQLRAETATWMDKTLVDVPTDSVQKVAVKNEHGTFEVERVDGDWIVVTPGDAKGRSCSKDKIDPIVRAAASLTAAAAAGRLDPSSQGLGDDATTVTLTHGEGTTTVRIGRAAPDNASQVYVTRDGFGFAATQWESSFSSVQNAKLEELLP